MRTLRITWGDGDDEQVGNFLLPLNPAALCEGMTFENFYGGDTSYRRVSEFSFSTGDMNPVYLLDEAGKKLGFGGRILPGRFVGSLVEGIVSCFNLFREPILESVQEEYKKPIRPGEKLQFTFKVLHVRETKKRGRFLIALGFWACDENRDTVIIGTHTFFVSR